MSLTRKRKMARLEKIINDPATPAGDAVRALRDYNKLEAGKTKRTKPSGRPFQKKYIPIGAPETNDQPPPSAPASAELPPGPATADNSRRQREAMQAANEVPSPQQQAAEQIHLVAETRKAAEKKAADDRAMREAQAWAAMKRAEAEAAMIERGIIEDPLAPTFPGSVRLTNALLDHWSDPSPPRKHRLEPETDCFGIRILPPLTGSR
jgi:hypothetical protein